MDQMMVDISHIEDVHVGERAVLLGSEGSETITAEDIAGWAGTISYEILLGATERVERTFIR